MPVSLLVAVEVIAALTWITVIICLAVFRNRGGNSGEIRTPRTDLPASRSARIVPISAADATAVLVAQRDHSRVAQGDRRVGDPE